MDPTPAWSVYRYHDETKHRYGRYAKSLGYLDWATQPNPFRSYDHTTPILLPLLEKDPEGEHLDLYDRSHNTFWDFQLPSVAAFLELSMGLSAWKVDPHGNTWSLRMNPSSGNLHPTEAHLILPGMSPPSRLRVHTDLPAGAGLAASEERAGLYHYNVYWHALEPRAILPAGLFERIQGHFRSPGFLVGLTSIVWRESWKYGERALRYCHHDIGHALAGMSFAANLLGWKVTVLGALSSNEIAAMLGIQEEGWPAMEKEEPDLLCFVSPSSQKAIPRGLSGDVLSAFGQLSIQGRPHTLSRDHMAWPLIDETLPFLKKPRMPEASVQFQQPPLQRTPESLKPAAALIRQRRSALAFDGQTSMSEAQFLAILDKTLPRHNTAPFDVELGPSYIHLCLFVHRVLGLPEGLYLWVRDAAELPTLKRTLARDFVWKPMWADAPLYLLKEGDYRALAAQISCTQEIAGKCVFSLGMLSAFRRMIDPTPWAYPQLFWEAGMIGQTLYLEAEAQGFQGTGIGCFFDDAMHELLGLRDNAYQSLYHFAVGGAVNDGRLSTKAPYAHLPKDRRQVLG